VKPLDPRLVRRSSGARTFLGIGAVLALVQALATIAFAWGLASLIAGLVAGEFELAAAHAALVAAAVLARGAAAWAWDAASSAGAQRVKRDFRADLLAGLERRPGGVPGFPSARIATLLGPGLDALDEYFGRYLPQLVLAGVATPLLILAAWRADWLSGLTFVIVLPLIPIFMILIGLATQAVQRKQWDSLTALSKAFLELLGGLSTLMVFGRERRQAARIRAVTDDYRRQTMKVLRVTFLSGFALELAASLSVALVAVSIGLRLVEGGLTLAIGLFVLILAPEVFVPLRNVGAAFHSAAGGVTASGDALDLLAATEGGREGAREAGREGGRENGRADAAGDGHDRGRADVSGSGRGAEPAEGREGAFGHAAHGARTGLVIDGLSVPRGARTVVASPAFEVAPGEVVALVGPSGTGKSSVIAAVLGFADATGRIEIDGVARPGSAAVAWSAQTPALVAGSVVENVRLGDEDAPPNLLNTALRLADVELDPGLRLGPGGTGLSGGQSQRVAVARAIHRLLARDLTLLVLDEPSSALDAEREAALARGMRELADAGRAVLVATHRPALVAAADRIVPMGAEVGSDV
jgi:ATP-binding cassette subfamily C protein CydD